MCQIADKINRESCFALGEKEMKLTKKMILLAIVVDVLLCGTVCVVIIRMNNSTFQERLIAKPKFNPCQPFTDNATGITTIPNCNKP